MQIAFNNRHSGEVRLHKINYTQITVFKPHRLELRQGKLSKTPAALYEKNILNQRFTALETGQVAPNQFHTTQSGLSPLGIRQVTHHDPAVQDLHFFQASLPHTHLLKQSLVE